MCNDKSELAHSKFIKVALSSSAWTSCPPGNEWHFTGSGYICNREVYLVLYILSICNLYSAQNMDLLLYLLKFKF